MRLPKIPTLVLAVATLVAACGYILHTWLMGGCWKLLDVDPGAGWVWRAAWALLLIALRLIGALCAGIGAIAIALAVEAELHSTGSHQ